MAEYLSPGVYVEEFDSGGVPMQGVSTSTAGFVGVAEKGPVSGAPLLVTSFADFKRKFGGYLPANVFGNNRFLAYAVEHFFINGGSRAYVARVTPTDAVSASADTGGRLGKLTAKNPGVWGNSIVVTVRPSSKAKTVVESDALSDGKITGVTVKSAAGFLGGDVVVFTDKAEPDKAVYARIKEANNSTLELEEPLAESFADVSSPPSKSVSTCEFSLDVVAGDSAETFENLSFNPSAPGFVTKALAKSELITIELAEDAGAATATAPFVEIAGTDAGDGLTLTLSGGSSGTGTEETLPPSAFMGEDNGPGRRTGIQAFLDNPNVSLMSVPGCTEPAVLLALVAHCELTASRFAAIDMPREIYDTGKLKEFRDYFDTQYAALYHPWLTVYDPAESRSIAMPPSGSVLGIYARADTTRGVHKAPANEVVRNCVGLDISFGKGEQDILNPVGINLIRSFPGQGIRVWGARTASSNGLWKYINVRRLFIYVEESIKANTNWVVFEPNDARLWARVKRTIDVFLNTTWRSGALQGASASEAFYVNVGPETMTQDDIDNGRLICEIGIAPVKPAEFVIFRLTQKTAT